MLRRTIYPAALIATGALLDELLYATLVRHPLHLRDRGVRWLDRLHI